MCIRAQDSVYCDYKNDTENIGYKREAPLGSCLNQVLRMQLRQRKFI